MSEVPGWMKSPVANLDYAERNKAYYEQLLESERTGECIFCAPGFPNDQPIVWENDGWVLCECRPKRLDVEGQEVDVHLLLYSRKHGEEMCAADWLSFGAAYDFVTKELGWQGGGFGWRFGDPAFSGRTVIHRHAHFFMPRQKFSDKVGRLRAVPVNFPIG